VVPAALIALQTARATGAELKVDLNPPDRRGDVLTPHWENWACRESPVLSNRFGQITIVLRAARGYVLSPALFKGSLDYGAHMASDGVVLGAPVPRGQALAADDKTRAGEKPAGPEIEMIISGLSAGRHTLATYHNEVRDLSPGAIDIFVGNDPSELQAGWPAKVQGLIPTKRATNDYEVASAFFEVRAIAGKDALVHFRPSASNSGQNMVLNGFEIDAVDPHRKAIKPSPANDDEHAAPDTVLTWTAARSAASHDVYIGSDSKAVARATRSSPEFKGNQALSNFRLQEPSADRDNFWRVDEIDSAGTATRGELWRCRVRSLAFPTAEGYGRFALGGRGGQVIEVTNLEDYDSTKGESVIPGSFRAAVETDAPRTIVFRVSGLIRLKRPCAVTKPYCTIAGQTAPGDGICLANFSSGAFGTHDVIIRFMRFRIGDFAKKAMDGAGLGSCDHCIMDHCSISWSSDEGTSSRGAKNITFQRNIVAEALHHSYHYRASDRSKFETHAFAGSISGGIGSFHHNLLADCTDRNWSLAGGYNQSGIYTGVLDIRNNVVYNWTARTTDGGVARMNYVNNYYKPYPGNPYVKWLLKLDPIDPAHGTEQYYMAGNIMEGQDYEDDNWKAFQNGAEVEKLVRVDHPLFEHYVTTHSARQAFTNVLADVGATFPKQDVIDRRIIQEVRDGTTKYTGTKGPTYGDRPSRNFAGIIDEPTDDKDAKDSPNFPWPEYRTYNVLVDSDHDGIPDEWEKRAGLNPNDPTDANQDRNGDGYTNLEEYLGWLVGEFPDPEKAASSPHRISHVAP
jgi:hypothetical protein